MTDPARPASERTRVRRVGERGVYDRETLYCILDQGLVGHVGFTGEDGRPRVVGTRNRRAVRSEEKTGRRPVRGRVRAEGRCE